MRRHRPGRPMLLMGLLSMLGMLQAPGSSGWAQAPPHEVADAERYDAKGRRDPFTPLVRDGRVVSQRQSVGPFRPVLYGILWDPAGRSIALINDLEVNVGDQIDRYRVEEIRPDAVVLTQEGGERIVLKLAFDTLEPSTVSTP